MLSAAKTTAGTFHLPTDRSSRASMNLLVNGTQWSNA